MYIGQKKMYSADGTMYLCQENMCHGGGTMYLCQEKMCQARGTMYLWQEKMCHAMRTISLDGKKTYPARVIFSGSLQKKYSPQRQKYSHVGEILGYNPQVPRCSCRPEFSPCPATASLKASNSAHALSKSPVGDWSDIVAVQTSHSDKSQ